MGCLQASPSLEPNTGTDPFLHVTYDITGLRYASKKSVRTVSNGREITFEVLRGAREPE